MQDTKAITPTHSPLSSAAGGAIVPVSATPVDIEKYAQDVYLALPREKQGKAAWSELATYAAQGNWTELEAIYNHFSSSHSLTYSDNSRNDRHELTYTDNRSQTSLDYNDDRTWHENHVSYVDNRSELDYYSDESQVSYQQADNRSWITHDNRSWDDRAYTYTDSRSYIDNSSYAPEVNHNYYVDNSIAISIDGSFNNNGNGNGNHSSRQLPAAREPRSTGMSDSDGWDRICKMLVFFLCCIFICAIWKATVVQTRIESEYYAPQEIR